AVLAALRPDLLVFAKLDVWPELVAQAVSRQVPCALVAGTVLPDSGRLGWLARTATHDAYASLASVGAVGADDVSRLVRLGAVPSRITITGDPRADAVVEGIDAVDPADPLCRLADDGATLVAGSTWPDDEAVVLAAFATVRTTHPHARLILVPHEPTPAHLAALDAQIAAAALPAAVRLSAGIAAAQGAPIVIVDSVGALARLYRGAIGAWVGGGFGDAGVHSVLEPAAWSVPIAIGPRDRGAREAQRLAEAGALSRVHDAGMLAQVWRGWLAQPDARRAAGEAARAVVAQDVGAAQRTAALLLPWLSAR
ncbi:MAG TPA: glycosyltransferase N-terminal domain-containing protein, partial [Gemmatimonadales bacterium]|nr:glycosyltransferase N-terminal domain-containing protein [Gemmatimonadales bacterium]